METGKEGEEGVEMKPGMCKFMRRRGFCWREDFNMSG